MEATQTAAARLLIARESPFRMARPSAVTTLTFTLGSIAVVGSEPLRLFATTLPIRAEVAAVICAC